MSSMLPYVLTSLLARLPVYLVLTVGMVYAVSRLGRNRTAARLSLAALAIMLAGSVGFAIPQVILPQLLVQNNVDGKTVRAIMTLLAVGSSLVHSIGLGLLLLAVFIERPAGVPRGASRPAGSREP